MKLFLVLAFAFLVLGQTQVDKLFIDSFELGENSIVITIPANANFPISDFDVYTDSGNPSELLGGERDLRLTAESGSANRILVSQVNDGEWNTATPNSASGFAYMQWDGKDNSVELDTQGLGGVDFTDNGLATRIHAVIETDIETQYTFTVYDMDGGECSETVEIPGTEASADYFINYSSFSGNCDFTNVGAVDVLIEAFDNVDSIIFLIATNGIQETTKSPTPSPSRNPPTPSRTPSPSALNCFCDIPTFECDLDKTGRRIVNGIFGLPPNGGIVQPYDEISTDVTNSGGVDVSNSNPDVSNGSGASALIVSVFAFLLVVLVM